MWIKECKKSFKHSSNPLIPIIINRRNKHWIEWVKIIYIESQNISIGVSLKYEANEGDDHLGGKCMITSILLDRGDILNKHNLVGINSQKYIDQLSNFNTSITRIDWIDKTNPLDQKIIALKRQIQYQQESIQRLKGSISRLKGAARSGSASGCNTDIHRDSDDDRNGGSSAIVIGANVDIPMIPGSELNAAIKSFVSESSEIVGSIVDDNIDQNKLDSEWLDKIVDQVIKKYNVGLFQTDIVGAKRNIYVDKKFIKTWINKISETFQDEPMMYYWLDYTISMQMIQKYAKTYTNKTDNEFIEYKWIEYKWI